MYAYLTGQKRDECVPSIVKPFNLDEQSLVVDFTSFVDVPLNRLVAIHNHCFVLLDYHAYLLSIVDFAIVVFSSCQ